ncbi:hypothetical protein L210DRAFT_885292, partial [Boletus edulis BED1]
MDHEYDVLGGYIPSFVQHLQDTGAWLGLRIGSQANEGQISVGDAAKEDTEAQTDPGWSPDERDAFFRAISVHSRWRPDLIAACVPTKSEWDVWMYLEALEEGTAMMAIQQGDGDRNMDMDDGLVDERRDVEMQVDPDSRAHSGSDEDADADLGEPALEVSQAWIDAEEHMASWIIDEEHRASVEGDTAAETGDMDDKPRKRRRGRRRGSKKERAHSLSQGRGVSNKGSPPPVHRSASPEATSTSTRDASRDAFTPHARKREALMGRLEVPHLLVLDSILREGGESTKEQSKSREGSVTAALLIKHGDDGAPRARAIDVSSLSDRITGPQETRNVPESSSDVVIDPVLLALCGGPDPAGRQSGQVTSGSTAICCAPTHVPAQGSSSSVNVSSQPTSLEVSSQLGMFTFPQDNATLTNPDPNANAEPDPSLFSPRTRRRIQKRLYMRRKRALLRGDGPASEDVVDRSIEKLKPGKKAKSERSEISVVSTSVPYSEAPSDAEAELPENVPKKNKPGLTLPYKLKAQFAELGVNAGYLHGQGMDLLNLGALGKLMGLYSSLEHDGEEEEADGSAITESIDAQLIRHLQAAVVSFVTDIMHRAIVWREREIRLKQRSRAWGHGDQITIGAVEHAVEAIGARYHSHKAYLRALEEAHYGLSTEASSTPANAADEPSPRDASVDPGVGEADLLGEPPGLSVHRDVYMPLMSGRRRGRDMGRARKLRR